MRSLIAISLLVLLLSHGELAHAQTIGSIQCGDIVEGEVIAGQSETSEKGDNYGRYTISFDSYLLEIQAGTRIDLIITPLGNTFNVVAVLLDSGGNDIIGVNENPQGLSEQFVDFPIASSNQVIRILGAIPDGVGFALNEQPIPYSNRGNVVAGHYFGAYEIRLGCTLRDGTIVLPGETPASDSDGSDQVAVPAFTGFGFPGIAPVDFSTGIEIPLQVGQLQTAPLGGDIALYTYQSSVNEMRTLTVSRLSGNISIGVTVINRSTNEVLFLGGMPSSNNLSVELTFPSEGVYAIGLFRLNTAERTGTSGAVQISIQ